MRFHVILAIVIIAVATKNNIQADSVHTYKQLSSSDTLNFRTFNYNINESNLNISGELNLYEQLVSYKSLINYKPSKNITASLAYGKTNNSTTSAVNITYSPNSSVTVNYQNNLQNSDNKINIIYKSKYTTFTSLYTNINGIETNQNNIIFSPFKSLTISSLFTNGNNNINKYFVTFNPNKHINLSGNFTKDSTSYIASISPIRNLSILNDYFNNSYTNHNNYNINYSTSKMMLKSQIMDINGVDSSNLDLSYKYKKYLLLGNVKQLEDYTYQYYQIQSSFNKLYINPSYVNYENSQIAAVSFGFNDKKIKTDFIVNQDGLQNLNIDLKLIKNLTFKTGYGIANTDKWQSYDLTYKISKKDFTLDVIASLQDKEYRNPKSLFNLNIGLKF